jgi:cell division protein ZapA (FtsZ GTPase activity inhibitor)
MNPTRRTNQVNRGKASSHPTQPGAVYIGTVKSHNSQNKGLPTIFVQQLGCTYNNVKYLNNSKRLKLKPNDQVLCTFVNLELNDIYILGAFNAKTDIFAGTEKFNNLITELQTQINTLRSALNLANINLTSYKQTD